MKSYALITGATSGIGLSLARIHASKKGNLIIVGRNGAKLSKLKNELEHTFKIDVMAFSVDLSKETSVNKLINRIKDQKLRVKYLINNAGFGLYGEFKDTSIDREVEMIELNIKAVTMLSKAFLYDMKQHKKGYIMNVGSVASFLPGPLMSVYYASKNYVLAFSQALNEELKGTGVSVTCLCPGPTLTNFTKTARGEKAEILTSNLMSADDVAQIGYESMLDRKTIVIPGFRNKLIVFATRILSRRRIVSLVHKATSKLNKG